MGSKITADNKYRGFTRSAGGESTDSCSTVSDSCVTATVDDVTDSCVTAANSDFGGFMPRLSTTSSCFTGVSDSCNSAASKASLDSASTLMES